MSSAILYLAIVAIWAVVLVPRWLRPAHGASRPVETENHEWEEPGHQDEDGWAEDDHPAGAERADTWAGHGREAAQPEAPVAPPERAQAERAQAERTGRERTERAQPGPGRVEAGPRRAGPSDAERRAHIVQARRRTLATLVVLTAGAVAIALTHLAASWVLVPPVLMLAGFLLLLREAARIDADRARRAAHRAAREHEAQPVADEQAEADGQDAQAQPGAAPEAGPTAEIIDISARLGDQLYDQYTDAAVRAIGD